MNNLKIIGASCMVAGGLTKQDWLFIISVIITILGMLQTYWENRKK